jgi:malate dehydrogenase (oxaloacetate-decarboxylating)
MAVAAAEELALYAEEQGLHEDRILPTMDDWEIYPREAAAVGVRAQEQGVARLDLSRDELLSTAKQTIQQAQQMTRFMVEKEIIPPLPEAWS